VSFKQIPFTEIIPAFEAPSVKHAPYVSRSVFNIFFIPGILHFLNCLIVKPLCSKNVLMP